MSTITQNIPTFLYGISQQPDNKKSPGQLKNATNTFPDYALGMLKRPGGKFVEKLYNAENISTTIATFTHDGSGHASRTVNRYAAVAASGGSGSGATFNVHAIAVNEVKAFTHNGVAASNRTAGTYYVANAGGSGSGTGADFKVVVKSDGEPVVTLDDRATKTGGTGYAISETITIADSSLGSGGAAAVVLTVSERHAAVDVTVELASGGKGYVAGETLTIADSVLGSGGGPAITVTVATTGTYGKWFSILRDENEKYIGQYADDTFRVWSLLDGSPRKVDMGDDTGVPAGCNYTNLQTDLLAYNTTVADTNTKTTALNTSQSTFATTNDGQDATKIENWVTTFDYDTGIGEITETLKSGIYQIETDNTYTVIKDNVVKSISKEALSGPVLTLVRDEDNKGSGYSAGTHATTTTGDGTGLTVTITVTGGVPDQLITIATGGGSTVTTGYKVNDVITISTGGANSKWTVTAITWEKGTEKTFEHPHLSASNNRKLYSLIETVAATHSSAQLTTATNNMNTAQTNYNNAVSAEATAKGNYDTEVTACTIPGLPSTGYLRGATADDIELLTLNDFTYVLNKKKTVAMTSRVVPALPTDAFIVINVTSYNSKYEVILNGVTVDYTTPQDASAGDADATVIVAGLVSAINGAGGAAASCVATPIGPGIHVTLVTSIKVAGGPQENALYAFVDSISDMTLLPIQCLDGYKVKIVNSESIVADDMWVQFSTSGTSTTGPGTWAESNEPGISYELDPLTMPHQLVRQADGSFAFDPVSWENRDVGDEVTNPLPTFVGSTIRNMFFYRNRFGFLSGDTVVMSKAGSFYDFFAGSAQVAAPDDPIDISASSTKPLFLHHVKTSSAGLVLFSDNEQFLLSTDSDILSPETAKINALSNYECDDQVEPVNLGNSLAFVSKTPLYSRLFEIFNISTTDSPQTFDQTKIVPELVPATIDNIAASAGMSMVSFGQTGTSTLYQYRFYQVGEKRAASTWYKWDLTGNLIDQFFDVSTFYAVVADGSNVNVVSIDLRQASDEGFLTLSTGEKTDVCMDMWNSNPYRTYTSGTDTTRVFLPFTHISGKTLAVLALGGYIGGALGATDASVGSILQPTVAGSAGSEYVDISGDYRGKNLIIGYLYTMTVDLPRFYYSTTAGDALKTDYTSDLIMHRIKVSTGLSGPVKYNVNLTGIPDRSQTVSVIQPAAYQLNDVAMAADAVHTVPIHQRNENVSLSIVGDTPLPVTLLGMNWEGKYTNKFYSRI